MFNNVIENSSSSSENEYKIGSDDIRMDFENKIVINPRSIKGNYTSPEDIKQIVKNKNKNKKLKNKKIMSDDIRPGGNDNEPDPDHFNSKNNFSPF